MKLRPQTMECALAFSSSTAPQCARSRECLLLHSNKENDAMKCAKECDAEQYRGAIWRGEQRGQLGQLGFAMAEESNAGVGKATAVAPSIKERILCSRSEVVYVALIYKRNI